MESRIKKIENMLDNNLESHPNLVKLWKHYIIIKKQNLDTALSQCENMLESISRLDDQTPEQLVMISEILNMVFANTT